MDRLRWWLWRYKAGHPATQQSQPQHGWLQIVGQNLNTANSFYASIRSLFNLSYISSGTSQLGQPNPDVSLWF